MTIHIQRGELPEVLKKLGIKLRRKSEPLEHYEQVQVIEWARLHHRRVPMLQWLYAVPNGGHRRKGVAGMLRAEGVISGVADLALPMQARGFNGLFIEMKSAKGKLTPEQGEFLRAVAGQHFCAVVAYGADQAIRLLEWYCGLSERKPDVQMF